MNALALLGGAAVTTGVAVHLLRSRSHSPQAMIKIKTVTEGRKDLSKNIHNGDTSPSGPLAAIFADSGWSKTVDVRDGKPMDWCGMTVAAWAWRAGMLKMHRNSFWATGGVRSFFSYAQKGTHRRTVGELNGRPIRAAHEAGGSLRRWIETTELRGIPLNQLDIMPGDVGLIAHRGQTDGADHIVLIESFDGRMLTTLEGNASGRLQNGTTVRNGVVRKVRDLSDAGVRKTLFGVGRFSRLDFE